MVGATTIHEMRPLSSTSHQPNDSNSRIEQSMPYLMMYAHLREMFSMAARVVMEKIKPPTPVPPVPIPKASALIVCLVSQG